ncbi:conserved hypothetical protein [Frankia sp. AiPs1]|uniref:hypothetical protein n=1 Tax=Frankia sp. AiPa1 TaxID=573492 RepID=UPI00202B06D2|nr:hypothetical protein [Frankia sp. AiPa1]MCL9759723.1 hypothetical protein [Frankia sp. AiPa1]
MDAAAWLHPEPHEWVDEPDADMKRAIDEAHEDVEAGRTVFCLSDAAFDALLDELDQLAAEEHPKAS